MKDTNLQEEGIPIGEQTLLEYIEEIRDSVDDLQDAVADIESKVEELPTETLQGDKGERGIQGERGSKGEKGDQGERGIQGLKGARGDQGEPGTPGIPGTPGMQGNKGTSVTLKEVLNGIMPSVLSRIPRGGGNMNRNISIGGNASVLSRYTDINLKAGSNMVISYVSNGTTKNTDITFTATGGGGSVLGTTRSINTISTSQTAGNTSLTDYIYICSAGIKLTLPDATGNSNLYTVKNTSASSVLVATTSAQTIDTQSTVILPLQYTAIDLISDGTNWDIT